MWGAHTQLSQIHDMNGETVTINGKACSTGRVFAVPKWGKTLKPYYLWRFTQWYWLKGTATQKFIIRSPPFIVHNMSCSFHCRAESIPVSKTRTTPWTMPALSGTMANYVYIAQYSIYRTRLTHSTASASKAGQLHIQSLGHKENKRTGQVWTKTCLQNCSLLFSR